MIALYGPKNPEIVRVLRAFGRHPPRHSVVFLHNDKALWGTFFYGYKIVGGVDDVRALAGIGAEFCTLVTGTTVGRYETAMAMTERGGALRSVIHPSVDTYMTDIGPGAYVQEGVVIQAGCRIGNNFSAHIGSLIAHECRIGHSVFTSFATAIAGECEIGDGAFIGANATIMPRLRVGKWATVGAGAVVTKSVPDYAIVVGNPARKIGENPVLHDSGNPVMVGIDG